MWSFMQWNSIQWQKGWRTDPRYDKNKPGQHYAKWKQSVSHKGPYTTWVRGCETSRGKTQRQEADCWVRRAEWSDCENGGDCEQVWGDDDAVDLDGGDGWVRTDTLMLVFSEYVKDH